MMKNKFIVFGSPQISKNEIAEVVDSLKSGWIGTGPKVSRFEEDFRRYKKAPFSCAVNSCTAALHLSLLAAGIGTGDEVITTAMTFCATVNAIIHSGATPVLADCDPQSRCILPSEIKKKITPRTKAVVVVHFAGNVCDMDAISSICRQHKLKLIEDCAHSIESTYKGKPVGTFGDFGCFSFYVTKNVVTGEGGMVLTKKKKDAGKIRILSLHGMSKDAWKRFSDRGYKHYKVFAAGFKYNLTDLQAAIGIHQLARVDKNWIKRKKIWEFYQKELKGLPLILPAEPKDIIKHSYHLYCVCVDEKNAGLKRDDFLQAMYSAGIGTGVHYESVTSHPYYRNTFGWKSGDYPNSYAIGKQTVSLPLSPKLNSEDIARIVLAVKRILKKPGK